MKRSKLISLILLGASGFLILSFQNCAQMTANEMQFSAAAKFDDGAVDNMIVADQIDPVAIEDSEPAPVVTEEQVAQVVDECRSAEKFPFVQNLNLKAERSEYFYDIEQGEMVNAVHSSLIILRGTQSNSSIAKINATHSVIVLCDIAEIKEIHGAKNVVILVNSNISKSTLAQSDVKVIEQ